MNRHRRLRLLLAGVVALTAACTSTNGGDAAPATTTTVPPAPTSTTRPAPPPGGYDVVTHEATLVDPTRATPDLPETGVAPADSRTLVTTFAYPDVAGSFPLVVFAHGHNGHPRKMTELFHAWAAAGFVVAAPTFPLSNDDVPGQPSVFDLTGQAGDVGFVISEALRMTGQPGSFLQGRVNPEEIGVAGLSWGGATVYEAAFDDCCRDRRIDAAIVMEAPYGEGDGVDLHRGIPLLVMHADGDFLIPYAQGRAAFEEADPPKYLITIHEAVHASPYEDTDDPAHQMVLASTADFLRLHVAHDADAAAAFSTDARVAGLTTVDELPG